MKTQERLDGHDRQIAAIRALVQEGMRLAVETRRDMCALARRVYGLWPIRCGVVETVTPKQKLDIQ